MATSQSTSGQAPIDLFPEPVEKPQPTEVLCARHAQICAFADVVECGVAGVYACTNSERCLSHGDVYDLAYAEHLEFPLLCAAHNRLRFAAFMRTAENGEGYVCQDAHPCTVDPAWAVSKH